MHVKTTISALYHLIGVWPLLFLHATRYAQIKRMRTTLIVIVFILTSCTSKTYLEIAENEINEKIEEKLTLNDSSFSYTLEAFFENYIISNRLVDSNNNKGLIYYSYIKYVRENGGGVNNIEHDSQFEKIIMTLSEIGLNTDTGIQNLLYKTTKPIVDKYHTELNDGNFNNELIMGISETNPEDEVNMTVVIDGLLKNNQYDDFNRPFLKKFVILFVFVQLELNE